MLTIENIKDLIPQLPTTLPQELRFLSILKTDPRIQAFNRAASTLEKDSNEFTGHKFEQDRFALHFLSLSLDPLDMYNFLKPKSTEVGPNSGDKDSITPFHFAALAGKSYLCAKMSQDGGNPNQGNGDGVTPLMLACVSGSKETVEALKVSGNFTQGTNAAWNVLHFAALGDSDEVVKVCFNNGAQFHGNSQGITPVHIAAMYGYTNAMQGFIEQNLDFLTQRSDVNTGGLSPLDMAAMYGQSEIIKLFNKKIKEFKVNEGNSEAITPLHRAAKAGHADACAELIKLGANANQGNEKGNTPVHFAAEEGHYKSIEEIYNNSQDLDFSFYGNTSHGNTPLHLACEGGHLNAAYYFVKKNSNSLTAENKKKHTPLDLACQFGSVPLVAMLLDKGAECTDNVFESSIAHPAVMKLMLCHFQSKASQDDLKLAVSAEKLDITELLLKSGIAPNKESIETAASQKGDSILELLVKWGAKITQEIVDGAQEEHKPYLNELVGKDTQEYPDEYLDDTKYNKDGYLLGLYKGELDSNLVMIL